MRSRISVPPYGAPCVVAVLLVLLLLAPPPAGAQPSHEVCKKNGPTHPVDPCYTSFTDNKYGFHTGLGWGTGHNIALEWGARYSVDRCALAHDRHFWANGYAEGSVEETRSNNLNFYRCVTFTEVRLTDLNEAAAALAAGTRFELALLQDSKRTDYPYAAPPMALSKISAEFAKPNKAAPRAGDPVASCAAVYANAFYDPRKGGECWTCPNGYARTVLPRVTSGEACAEGSIFGNTFERAKFRGRPGCQGGSFAGGDGHCYKCPAGYQKFGGFKGKNALLVGMIRPLPDRDVNACSAIKPDP